MLMKLTPGQSSISLRLSGSGYLPPSSLFTGRHAVVGTVVKFTNILQPALEQISFRQNMTPQKITNPNCQLKKDAKNNFA
jgi:hypothetical protein